MPNGATASGWTFAHGDAEFCHPSLAAARSIELTKNGAMRDAAGAQFLSNGHP
jgi:hypothetical protein